MGERCLNEDKKDKNKNEDEEEEEEEEILLTTVAITEEEEDNDNDDEDEDEDDDDDEEEEEEGDYEEGDEESEDSEDSEDSEEEVEKEEKNDGYFKFDNHFQWMNIKNPFDIEPPTYHNSGGIFEDSNYFQNKNGKTNIISNISEYLPNVGKCCKGIFHYSFGFPIMQHAMYENVPTKQDIQ